MASNRKSKIKPRNHEIIFEDKRIDLKRFAYDVIKHLLLKFKVPEDCICESEDPENDYAYTDFISVVSGLILRHQIPYRYSLNEDFTSRCESNKLESFEKVRDLFQEIIKEFTEDPQTDIAKRSTKAPRESKIRCRIGIIVEVQITLSIACELTLFLHSKNSNLHVKELAKYWFDCYFHLQKKPFVKAGGFEKLYKDGLRPKHERMDDFFDKFISIHCIPYETSAKNEHLGKQYAESVQKYTDKIRKRNPSKESLYTPGVDYFVKYALSVQKPLVSSKRDEASGIELPENSGLGILPHEEMVRQVYNPVTDITPSQNLPEASSLEMAKNRRRSHPRRRQSSKNSLCSSVKQGLGQASLDSSRTKQSAENKPNVSAVHDPTPPPKPSGISSQEVAMQLKRFSCHQESKSSLFPRVEQSLAQLSLESSATGLSNEKKSNVSIAGDPTPSQKLTGASCQESAKEHRGYSSHKKRQRNSNSCSKEEE